MAEIARVLKENGERYCFLEDKYKNRFHDADIKTLSSYASSIYLVECRIPEPKHIKCTIIDHHRPGDPGYDCTETDYLNGSSLGQVLRLLKISPTLEQKYIAAADHCLVAAYRGKCPGIDPHKMLAFRLNKHAHMGWRFIGITMVSHYRLLLKAEKIFLDSTDESSKVSLLLNFRNNQLKLMNDAAGYFKLPFLSYNKQNGKVFCSGPKNVIEAFISVFAKKRKITIEYGAPNRGFVGGITEIH